MANRNASKSASSQLLVVGRILGSAYEKPQAQIEGEL
jgi:hypothetical protein